MLVVPVAGVTFRPGNVDDESFDPGRRVALVPEPDNEHDPNAVGIWNEERTLQAGLRPTRGRTPPERRRAGDLALAPRGWPARRDRPGRRLDRDTAVDSAPMPYEFKLPDLGEGLTEGEIARWLVSEGQEIAEDDPLVEIQTDKTTVEIPSPAAGKVTRILVAEGDVVPVGTVLVVIGGDGDVPDEQPRAEPAEQQEAAAAVEQPAPTGRVRATPLVRRVAQELGVELEGLTGTGPQRRITEEDVRAASGSVPGGQGPRGLAGNRCAASGARSPSTWRAPTARCRPSPGSRSAISARST